ncbi:MAG: hypothetical protein ACRDHE_04960 [Ktedonobacterales bacterium]
MRWTLFRRKSKSRDVENAPVAHSPAVAMVERPRAASSSLRQPEHLADDVLKFARDYFVASGAKVRVESADTLSVTTAEGAVRRFTSSLAQARAQADAELLVPGGKALSEIVEAIEARARINALRLSATYNAEETVRRFAAIRPGLADLAHAKLVVEEAYDTWSIEHTYEVTCRWRDGTLREWVTICLDAETLAVEQAVASDLIARAEATAIPAEARSRYEQVSRTAERALAHTLAATAGWLRLRGASAYAERLDDLRQTADRLARETLDEARTSAEMFEREARRLGDVFAVSAQASLARVSFIASPISLVRIAGSRGDATAVRVDLGRGTARVIGAEHLTSTTTASARTGETSDDAIPVFTAAGLIHLPERLWREAALWLLEDLGHVVERRVDAEDALLVHTRRHGRQTTVAAVRADAGQRLSAVDLRRAFEWGGIDGVDVVLLTPNGLDADANAEVARIGAQVTGPAALDEALIRRADAFERGQQEALTRAEERASLAAEVRAVALERLERLELGLAQATNGRRATGAHVIQAAATVREARTLAAQAFAAWETLLLDWRALFAERAARDGSLVIVGDETTLAALRERTVHLAGVLEGSFLRIGETPATGEFGYTAWRRAVVEELTAMCEAARWRLEATDPAQWRDSAAVVDAQSLERAQTALTAAGHARARAEKAYTQLAGRVRVEQR